MDRETILVTGSAGLIGAAVCAAFGARGRMLREFDIRNRRPGFGDILDRGALRAAMTGVGGVVHLAAVSRVVFGERDPVACRQTNVQGTQNVIDALREAAPRAWLIQASSREVYGQCDRLPVTEAEPPRPMNAYARSKLAAEQAVRAAIAGGLGAAILRFSTVYGAVADHSDRLIPAFCRAALDGRALHVEGAENCVDITHVRDVAGAVCDLAERLAAGEELPAMHLTTGRPTGLADLARLVVRLADSRSPIHYRPPRAYDVARFAGDPTLAAARIGWQPRVALQDGLAELLNGYRAATALQHG